jgi:hypothetical protein
MFTALYLEFLSFVLGCILVRKTWPWHYRFLVVLKGLSFLVQWGGMAWSTLTHSSNHWIFNVYLPLECVSYLYIFYRASASPIIRRLNGWLTVTVLPLVVISFLLSPQLFIINQMMGMGCDFLLLISACVACIGLLLSEEEVSFFRNPLFWLAGGVLYYSIGNIIYLVTWEVTRKMVLYKFIRIEFFLSGIVLNLALMGSFFCMYLWDARRRRDLRRS